MKAEDIRHRIVLDENTNSLVIYSSVLIQRKTMHDVALLGSDAVDDIKRQHEQEILAYVKGEDA